MADETAPPGAEAPLVSVTFQRNPHQKIKYLESEPKALGITQIVFSVFHIISFLMIYINGMNMFFEVVSQIIGSMFVIVAGILAIAAQSLHLPTLKACLGMQVVACGSSVINLVFSVEKLSEHAAYCWVHISYNETDYDNICYRLMTSTRHFYAEWVLIQTVLIAISATLAAYCCKVVECCSPGQRMPKITVQAPPSQQ